MSQALEKKAAGMPTVIDREAILNILHLNPREPTVQALILVCEKYGLDPILKHAMLVEGRLYVTRDGLLHVAHASGQLDGIEVLEQDQTDTHHVAKVAVYRKDMSRAFTYVGRYPKLRTKWTGPQSNRRQEQEVHPYGPEMAVKCAEVMGLRRAFDIALAAREELWDVEDVGDPVPVSSTVVTSGASREGAPANPGTASHAADDATVPSSESSPAPGDPDPEPAPEKAAAEPREDAPDDPARDQSGQQEQDPPGEAADKPWTIEEMWAEAKAAIGTQGNIVKLVREAGQITSTLKVKDITIEQLKEAIDLHRVKKENEA